MTRSFILLGATCAILAAASARPSGEDPGGTPLSIRITSPLGRTGIHGAIRIVAQLQHPPDMVLQPVRFFVDQKLHGEAASGPPFAVEWVDENPYEPREISAEVCDFEGVCARDVVRLDPLVLMEEAQVSSVLIEASVQDESGRSINGLTLDDFQLLEDDVPQTLDMARADVMDTTYTLVIDSSQSMARRLDFVQLAAARLLRHVRPQDRIIVAPFTQRIGTITGPTDDRQTVAEAIRAIRADGGTAIMDVLGEIPRLLEGAEGRQAIVLITDGYDEHSRASVEDAVRAVKSAHATLFVVAVGGVAGISIKGERMLRNIAEQSGGRAFFPSRDQELAAVHDMIAADLQARYLLAYTPTNMRIDGTWRTIALKTRDESLTVRARPGYFAPKPPPVRAMLEFTVTNRDREPVEVSADDLVIVEDGVEQTLESFQEALAPVSIVLALDASGSMRGVADAVKERAKQFVEALRPQDKLALIVFSDSAMLVHDLTTSRDSTLRAIDEYVTTGGTALNDALYDALQRVKALEGRRAIVLMTDGRDENGPGTGPGSHRTIDDVRDSLREVEATVYTIGLGKSVDRETLDDIASLSGGEAFFPEAMEELGADYHRVVEHLRRRYVATYLSPNTERDGAWRPVAITSRDPRLEVRSRGGYWAPAN